MSGGPAGQEDMFSFSEEPYHPTTPQRRVDQSSRGLPPSRGVQPSPRENSDNYKYFVALSKDGSTVCTYCHIAIKRADLALMTRSQWNSYNEVDTIALNNSGFHCDCFFLSAHGAGCTKQTDIWGFNALNNYHKRYIARKITSTPEKELPKNIKVAAGYIRQGGNGVHYCEQCSMVVADPELKLGKLLFYKVLWGGSNLFRVRLYGKKHGFPQTKKYKKIQKNTKKYKKIKTVL
eukprot:sb/3469328/